MNTKRINELLEELEKEGYVEFEATYRSSTISAIETNHNKNSKITYTMYGFGKVFENEFISIANKKTLISILESSIEENK